MKHTSSIEAFKRLGGLPALWEVPDASHVAAALLVEPNPTIRHVQRLVDALPPDPSPAVLASLLLAVTHVCQSHPMLLLTPLLQNTEHGTLEEFLAVHVGDLVSDLETPSSQGFLWEGRWAPLVLQVRVHEALHELERLLKRLKGVGPVWNGPSIESLQAVQATLARNVGLYHCDDDYGAYLAPSVGRTLDPLQIRTAAGAYVLGTRFLKDVELSVDVARGLLHPDLLAPNGIRSLHQHATEYKPSIPLRGAIDPLDTAAAASGLDTLGLHAAANALWARLTTSDAAGYPRFLPGDATLSTGPESIVTVACSLVAKRRIGSDTLERERSGEDLPVGPVEEDLLRLLDC